MFTMLLELLRNVLPLFGYLKSQSFPQPLSPLEEERLVKLLVLGDRESRNLLIEHNLRLVAHIAKKYEGSKSQSEDLISIGTIGLIKAIDTFKPDKLNKLTTYAARCIENEILMHLRSIKKTYNDVSLNEPIGMDKDGNEVSLLDVVDSKSTVDVVDVLFKKEQLKKLAKYLQTLDEKEKEIIELRYGLNDQKVHTQRQIAKDKNISRSYVSRIEKRAFTKLMKCFRMDSKEEV
ncbi:MAG: RNA polymerase sporulation sigma factor SigK [Erysipelotrichaceae bacterium]|nr:RNA polymerase sporulation sigma factor SigK [Erysipelotrichaceae bacterium]